MNAQENPAETKLFMLKLAGNTYRTFLKKIGGLAVVALVPFLLSVWVVYQARTAGEGRIYLDALHGMINTVFFAAAIRYLLGMAKSPLGALRIGWAELRIFMGFVYVIGFAALVIYMLVRAVILPTTPILFDQWSANDLLLVLFGAGFFYITIRFLLFQVVLVADEAKIFDGFEGSWNLTRGRVLRLLGAFAMSVGVLIVIAGVGGRALHSEVPSMASVGAAIFFEYVTSAGLIVFMVEAWKMLGGKLHVSAEDPVLVKICGINSQSARDAAVRSGALMLGFVFYPASPRALSFDQARTLIGGVPDGILKVALVVDPTFKELQALSENLAIDVIQLHGSETPDRVSEVKALTGLRVFKAVAISGPDDVARAHEYEAVSDALLFDAKPPEGADRPGGNALKFDWDLIAGETWACPWLLAGGLTAENVAAAIKASGAEMVDVSSGVEDAPGVKSAIKIKAFIKAAQTA